jgi:hypothetical protein
MFLQKKSGSERRIRQLSQIADQFAEQGLLTHLNALLSSPMTNPMFLFIPQVPWR